MEEPHNKSTHCPFTSWLHSTAAVLNYHKLLVCIHFFIKTQVLVSLFLFSLTAWVHYVFRQYDQFDVFLTKQMIGSFCLIEKCGHTKWSHSFHSFHISKTSVCMMIFCKVETETRLYYFILALVYRGFVFCVHTPVHLGNEVHIWFHNLSKESCLGGKAH